MLNQIDVLTLVRDFSYQNSEKDDIHGFAHVERVFKTCIEIGIKLNANIFLLKISSLLHDVGRKKQNNYLGTKNHANFSAEMSIKFLKTLDYEFSKDDLENISNSIRAHSFSNDVVPKTLEAQILSDADKLDALGAIGLYRTIAYSLKFNGGIKRVMIHLENKILRLRDKLCLDLSKKIAIEKHKLVLSFYEGIKNEICV
ncbi:MAG: HD domain-containing protein [Promethearchaeota archaeon]